MRMINKTAILKIHSSQPPEQESNTKSFPSTFAPAQLQYWLLLTTAAFPNVSLSDNSIAPASSSPPISSFKPFFAFPPPNTFS